MRVAVTGAGGFVGAAVVAAARARGWCVHALTRHEWDVTRGLLPEPPPVDAVVHAAAVVCDGGPAGPVWAANLHGTRHVAASFPGVRLVHVSTASVYDPFTASVRVRECAGPVDRYLTAYGASKAAAERLLVGRPDTVVLRPHAVYGPGDRTLLPRVLGAVRGRTLVVAGDGSSAHTLTSITNLVGAVLLACEPDAPPGTYNVGDAAPITLDAALAALFDACGLDVTVRHLPKSVAWPLAAVVDELAQVLPIAPRLTRYAVSNLGVERTLDLTAARTRLGLDPAPTSFRGAVDW